MEEEAMLAQQPDPERSLPEIWERDFVLDPEEPPLGGGAFARISKVVERATGKAFALKAMSRPNFALRGIDAQVDAEIDAMRRCAEGGRCRHVVRFMDYTEARDFVYIRMEMCFCDLLRFATCQASGRVSERDGRHWSKQLLNGLWDLHQLGIIHRDIKPENLLCTREGTLKIGDFGWCAEVASRPASLAGTLQYMAPEVLSGQEQKEPVDVWSAGVTMLQLLTARQLLSTYLGPGCTGISATDPHQATKVKTKRLLTEIRENCPLPDEERPSYLAPKSWSFLRMLLIPDVQDRATVPEALGHPWLQAEEANVEETTEEEEKAPAPTPEHPLTSSANSASMPALNVPPAPTVTVAVKGPAPDKHRTLQGSARQHPRLSPPATGPRRGHSPLSKQPLAPRDHNQETAATTPAQRSLSPQQARRPSEARAAAGAASGARPLGGSRFSSPTRTRKAATSGLSAITQVGGKDTVPHPKPAEEEETGRGRGAPTSGVASRSGSGGAGACRSMRRCSYPNNKASESASPEGERTRRRTAQAAPPAAPRNRRLTLPASPPLQARTARAPCSPSPVDGLSRTSPADCAKALQARVGPPHNSENEPAEANADPALLGRGESKAPARRAVVLCNWPPQQLQGMKTAPVHMVTTQRSCHHAVLSPRQPVAGYPMGLAGTATMGGPLLSAAVPATSPVPGLERCRDIPMAGHWRTAASRCRGN